jgi:two-component system sensor histidine kinase HydH
MSGNNTQKNEIRVNLLKTFTILQLIPAWLGNLLIFGLMVTIIFVYFFWQIEEARKTFLYYVREHTRIISEVIKQNAENLDRIEKIGQAPTELSHIFNQLSGISGISYVKIEPGPHKDTGGLPGSDFLLVNNNEIAETRINFGKDMLVVGLDTSHFLIREKQLANELIVFSAIIAFISAFFSLLIYLYQRAHIEQAREFERKLAKENEDAALGRASATITHEIRNPLNAIHMGLQRLQIEAEDLNEDHRNLISTILRAVKRTNGIVTDLRRYAAPLKPNNRQVDLTAIVQNMLTLYQQQCSDQAISVTFESRNNSLLVGDSGLLEEVVENFIKNAIEAQPDGGYLKISVFKQESHLVLLVENSGYDLSEKETENILEPYFTTKTRGSGLGLSVAKQIVLAHGGRIEVEMPVKGIIRISAYLPLTKGG